MNPKLNKLITLLLILGTFAFFMEAEERVLATAKKELSKWVSLLPSQQPSPDVSTRNPYSQKVDVLEASLKTILPSGLTNKREL
ncbi:MAG: hypothetical protein Tsb0034_02260 [Ekhidna sp.]